MNCSTPNFSILHCLQNLLKFMSIELVILSISSSATPFSFCLQFFLASGSFSVSWLFTSGGQSIGASAAVFPIHTKGWFPLGLIGFILLSRGWLSRVFLSTTVGKHQFFDAQPYGPTLTSVHDYWKNHSLDNTDLLLAKWCLCYLICCLVLSQFFFQGASVF